MGLRKTTLPRINDSLKKLRKSSTEHIEGAREKDQLYLMLLQFLIEDTTDCPTNWRNVLLHILVDTDLDHIQDEEQLQTLKSFLLEL